MCSLDGVVQCSGLAAGRSSAMQKSEKDGNATILAGGIHVVGERRERYL